MPRPGTIQRSTPPLARHEVSVVSPLRYPGSKRRLSGYVAEVLRVNSLRPKLFVEPFAGGASVSLALLNDGLVDSIALGEKDPLVAAFWKVIFGESDWLIDQIQTIDVTLANWDYFKKGTFSTDRERALACIFLNRTSFSGILSPTAGPIGGRGQKSAYAIDCRFPIKTLVRRIKQVAHLKDRVLFIENADWQSTLERVRASAFPEEAVFYYLDPPFFQKAERLYTHFFCHDDHVRLRNMLLQTTALWLLSYDPAAEIAALYCSNGHSPRQVELLYSMAPAKALVRAQELIISNCSRLPHETRLWRSSAEWKRVSSSGAVLAQAGG